VELKKKKKDVPNKGEREVRALQRGGKETSTGKSHLWCLSREKTRQRREKRKTQVSS